MKKNPKEHIETIAKNKSKPDDNTTTVARILNQQMDQLFHDPRNFIYELLQNADDAEATSVKFIIKGKNLILSHNGKSFTSIDVKRICDAARDSDEDKNAKTQQAKKIGYKGIGFKSVFGISKDIEILSDQTGYYFAFSQQYWAKNETKKIKFPWQILPIWIDDPHRSYETFEVPKENVIFILKNIDFERVTNELKAILNHPEIIVFFRKIATIQLVLDKNYSVCREPKQDNLLLIKVTDQSDILWYKSELIVEVTPDLRKILKDIPTSACPDKIKKAEATEITFAARVEAKIDGTFNFLSTLGGDLFCYLPTSVECGLPYLVNANFILSQDRATIIDNPWNAFLLETIGYQQFCWFGEIAQKPAFQNSVLSLLSQEDASTVFPSLERRYRQKGKEVIDNRLLESYKKGYERGVQEVSFVLSKTGTLLRLEQSILDTTEFFRYFDERVLDHTLIQTVGSCLVAYQLSNRDVLTTYKRVNQYDWGQLLNRISQYMQRLQKLDDLELRSEIIVFLFKSNHGHAFKTKPIVLNHKNELCVIQESFYLNDNETKNPYIEFPDINIINLSLYNAKAIKQIKNVVELLTVRTLIKNYLALLLLNHKIGVHNSVQILRFIYTACITNELNVSDFENKVLGEFDISRFPVITETNSLRELRSSILMDPHADNVTLSEQIISKKYFFTNDDMEIWNAIFICAGVKTTVELSAKTINYLELYNYFEEQFGKGNLISEYVDYIVTHVSSDTKGIPKTARTDANKQKLIFENFIFFDFLFYDEDPSDSLLHLFLLAANRQYSLLCQSPKMDRGLSRRSYSIEIREHFLAYYFREHCTLPIKGKPKRKHSKSLLYGDYLEELYDQSKTPINIVQLPQSIKLVPEVADILGFRKHISVEEGLRLLQTVQQNYKNKPIDSICIQRLQSIYRLLIQIELKATDKEIIIQWKRTNQILCLNDRFIPLIEAIEVFDKDQVAEKIEDSLWLHDVGLDTQSLQELADFFQLPCVSHNLNFVPNISVEPSFKKELGKLKQFIASILPIFVLMESDNLKIDYQACHKEVYSRFVRLQFIACDTIFSSGRKQLHWIGRKENCIYIAGSLKSKQGKTLEDLAYLLRGIFFHSSQIGSEFERAIKNYKNGTKIDDVYSWLEKFPKGKEHYEAMIKYQEQELEKELENALGQELEQESSFEDTKASEITEEIPNEETTTAPASNPPIEIPKPQFPEKKPVASYNNDGYLTPESTGGKKTGSSSGGWNNINKHQSEEKKKANIEKGKLGEKYVYKNLIAECRAHFLHNEEEKKGTCFILRNTDNNRTLEINWYNKFEESGKKKDLSIRIKENGTTIKKKIIEVKSTKYSDTKKFVASLSGGELQKAIKHRENYRFFRVFNVEVGKDPSTFTSVEVSNIADTFAKQLQVKSDEIKRETDIVKIQFKIGGKK